MAKNIFPYIWLILGLVSVVIFNQTALVVFTFFERSAEAHLLLIFFTIALICAFSFIIFYLSRGTPFPPFVIAILFGIAGNELLGPVAHEPAAIGAIVGFGATLILFSGGLETPWKNFKRLMWKITSLSSVGLGLTAFLFSFALVFLGNLFGVNVPITAAILLGAVLASTDPAAIIPVLKILKFHNRDTKDIVISESAVTDVTGTLLTIVFLSLLGSGVVFSSVLQGYGYLFTSETILILLKQIVYGVALGIVGYGMLQGLSRFKKNHSEEFETDAAYFLFVPVIIFTIALAFGGSGYLAAFIAGLLFVISENLQVTEKFFNHMIEGFFKPTIFLLLGAIVQIDALLEYTAIGIAAALLFMFVIRPLCVFFALGPFVLFGKNRMNVRELLFVSFVRETGAIPAVLLVTIVGLGMPGLDGFAQIGMWVIFGTLVLEPPLTPLVARLLNVATIIGEETHEEKVRRILSSRHSMC